MVAANTPRRARWKPEIAAWAGGSTIERRLRAGLHLLPTWEVCESPDWDSEDYQYRVAALGNSDTTRTLYVGPTPAHDNFWTPPNLELTFGPDGRLKKTRIVG